MDTNDVRTPLAKGNASCSSYRLSWAVEEAGARVARPESDSGFQHEALFPSHRHAGQEGTLTGGALILQAKAHNWETPRDSALTAGPSHGALRHEGGERDSSLPLAEFG